MFVMFIMGAYLYARSTSSLTSASMRSVVAMEQSLDCPICAPRNDGPPLLLHATWPSLSLMPIWVTIILAIRATCANSSAV